METYQDDRDADVFRKRLTAAGTDAASYIAAIARELGALAQARNHQVLAYLLSMAADEAESLASPVDGR